MMMTINGIPNIGNTCYMNAVLQSLKSSNVFNTQVLQHTDGKLTPITVEYIKFISNNNFNPTNFYIVLNLKQLIHNMLILLMFNFRFQK